MHDDGPQDTKYERGRSRYSWLEIDTKGQDGGIQDMMPLDILFPGGAPHPEIIIPEVLCQGAIPEEMLGSFN